MCRLAFFPPSFPRDRAIAILENMEGFNQDGTGSVYIKNGEFVVEKYPFGITEVLNGKHPFLEHLPVSDSWTMVHLRAATHGEPTIENTHPFITGDLATIHNGIFSQYEFPKLILSKFVKFEGETDSEVAAHLINVLGGEEFLNQIHFGGVFGSLDKKTGELTIIKAGGDFRFAEFKKDEHIYVVASEFNTPHYANKGDGIYKFSKEGVYVEFSEKKIKSYSTTNYRTRYNYKPFSTTPEVKTKTTKLFGIVDVGCAS